MNAPLLVTAAVCVGAPTLLAAALLYRERIRNADQRLDQLADDEHQIVDSEDHGHEPTDIEQQIIDNLRATPLEITPEMRDRAMERFRAQCLADLETHAPPLPVYNGDPEALLAEINAMWDETEPAAGPRDDSTLLTADELAADIAAYEAAAADRFRHAGVTWPTNPATVGIARYDSKAGKA